MLRDTTPNNVAKANLEKLFEELQVPELVREQWYEALISKDVKLNVHARILAYFSETRQIRVRKQADYGLSWRKYGLDGVFFNIATKFARLESLVWKRNAQFVNDESVRDTFIDMLNYIFYSIFLLEEENFRGKDNHDA